MDDYLVYLRATGQEEKWQHSGGKIKFFMFDWQMVLAFVPVIFFLFEPKAYMFSACLFCVLFVISRFGYDLKTLLAYLHYRIVGRKARAAYAHEERHYD